MSVALDGVDTSTIAVERLIAAREAADCGCAAQMDAHGATDEQLRHYATARLTTAVLKQLLAERDAALRAHLWPSVEVDLLVSGNEHWSVPDPFRLREVVRGVAYIQWKPEGTVLFKNGRGQCLSVIGAERVGGIDFVRPEWADAG